MQLGSALMLLLETLHTTTCQYQAQGHMQPWVGFTPAASSPLGVPHQVSGKSLPAIDRLVEESRTVHAGLVPTVPTHDSLILHHLYELLVMGERHYT